VGLKLNWTYQLLAYVDTVNLVGVNITTIRISTVLTDVNGEVPLEANAENTKNVMLSRHQNTEEIMI
jgi:hypothetical protein